MAQPKSHMNRDGLLAANISSAINGTVFVVAELAGCRLRANSLIGVLSSLYSPNKNFPGVQKQTP